LWWSFPVGSTLSLSLALLYYRFGGWRHPGMISKVIEEEAVEQAQADGEAGGRLNPSG